MQSGPVKSVIKEMKAIISDLEVLVQKYPHLYVEQTWDGDKYFTPDVNKIVDSFEKVSAGGYFFYIKEGNTKIYADPMGCDTETDEGYEYDWLPEIVDSEINPAVLVKLMRKINSKYVGSDVYYKILPYLKDWFNKY